MISFIDVTDKAFNTVFDKMTTAFPYEERRSFFDQMECMKNSRFKFAEICDNGISVGFIGLWTFESFVFIEHIAIDEDKRGGGYGTKAVELVKKLWNLPLILEAEAPETEVQKKRISFYERLGFKVNKYDYTQPSYHGGEGVPLMILSYPQLLTDEEFSLFLTETRKEVYKIK